jgi:hypothetical protein
VLDQALRGDPGHRGIGIVDAPPTVIAQREGEGLGDLVGRGGAELLRVVGGHEDDDTNAWERNKNFFLDANRAWWLRAVVARGYEHELA